MADYDAVLVGSGINSLVCAAFLARAGWRVAVLEREAELGGAVRTAELTEPGFHHDVFSAWHPLWVGSPAHAELGSALAERGLEYLNTEHPTGTLFPDGESAFLTTATDGNAAELDRLATGDGAAWREAIASVGTQAELIFGVLGTELWSPAGLSLGAKAYRRLGRRGLARFGAEVVQSSRDWLTTTFRSERAHGLLAPWVLHTGLGPEAAASGFMTRVIAFAIEAGGMPVPRGGGARLVDALVRLIRDDGGVCETGRDVERILVRGGRATAVRLAGGDVVGAGRAVICNVTPTQLYGRLLDPADVSADVADAGRRFRFGRSEMQIHFALSEPPRWEGDERLDKTAIVHLTPGLDGVSRAVNEAERGLLPAEATVVVGQPLALDDSRAPAGKGILWIQLQELPWHVKGDAAGELDVGNGTWDESLRERYADRIQARIGRHVPNLESSILRRVVLSPADLQAANINLEQGDPYSGSLALDQNFVWRPFARQPGHRTPVDGLFQIGASTWPGPGLGAGSGTLVAKTLLQPPAAQRIVGRLGAFLRPGQA
ncbi:MAG: NAD(P)/FAD-dependent oxidoreductase [Actinobacteria bacterium]|nr:MAG: NAD(P)/FAD-dependent oxidoreductase [Actinomycetota bacterium]